MVISSIQKRRAATRPDFQTVFARNSLSSFLFFCQVSYTARVASNFFLFLFPISFQPHSFYFCRQVTSSDYGVLESIQPTFTIYSSSSATVGTEAFSLVFSFLSLHPYCRIRCIFFIESAVQVCIVSYSLDSADQPISCGKLILIFILLV